MDLHFLGIHMRFRGDSLPRNTLESSSPSTFLMRLDSSSSLSVCNRTTERGKGQKHPKQEIQLSKRHFSGSSWNPHASPQGKSVPTSSVEQMGRCCVCRDQAQVCYSPCRRHSSPLPPQASFLLSFQPAPHSHYLVGFGKEGSLLREWIFLLWSRLPPAPVPLQNAEQVSVVVPAFRRRQRKES